MAGNHLLIEKLDRFIRKYYKNRLIRGILWSLTILAAIFLVFISLEYFFHFNQWIRMGLFLGYVGLALFLLVRLVATPAMQLARIGKIISHEQAAVIIGTHFSEIQDKLLNTLQLLRQHNNPGESADLVTASIEQKTNALRIFRFNMAIDFRKNVRYLRFLLVPALIILLLVILSPRTISDPTRRIVQFNQVFTPPLPFRVDILNPALTAVQQSDFELRIKVSGTEIPAEWYIRTREGTFRMLRQKGFVYSFVFKSVRESFTFRLASGDYQTGDFELKVFPKPTILNFDIMVSFPAYINKPEEKYENQGDLVVPEGSSVVWKFYTKDVSALRIRFGDETISLSNSNGNTFSHAARMFKSLSYTITPVNEHSVEADSLRYRINVINDGYPSVFITESTDSVMSAGIFFRGTVKDDYGFTDLTFHYRVFSEIDTSAGTVRSETIPIENAVTNQVFYHMADLARLVPEAGQRIEYYFEVRDNDGIHGPKSSRSEVRTLSTPTLAEIENRTDQNEKQMNLDLEQSLQDARAMKKSMEDLNKKMVEQTSISWQEKKKINDIIKASEAIEEKIEQIKKQNNENIEAEEKYLETGERIIEKQKQLNDMLDQMLPEELKKMIRELREMLDQIDKEKLGNLLEKMKMSNRELENQLDRNLEILKQLEFDRKLESTVKELRKTAEKQENLAAETEKKSESTEKLLEKQHEIGKKADSLSKQVDELRKQGKELETPADLGDTKNRQDSLRKNLSESSRNLKENKSKEASGSQKKAAQDMKELAQQMEESQAESEEDQLVEDADNIRMILEDLIRLSYEQEEMIYQTRQVARNDPRYPELIYRQKEFTDKMKVVEDSLNAIARRQIAVKPVILKEVNAINKSIELALTAMEERNIENAAAKQQFAMTSINNLALLLNEALQNMDQQLSSCNKSRSGNKSCSRPGGKGKGKMSAKSMKKMQENIGKQLENLKAGMESMKKTGQNGMQGQKAMNEQIARLAAEQEALRNEMRKYQDEMGTKGLKEQGALSEAEREMEKNERDLINKQITQETIQRQQRIMTRLLESEKAEQMRDQEEKREATEAKSQKRSNPGTDFQYNTKKRAGQDNLQLTLPAFTRFFQNKVSGYIVKIEN